MDNLDNAFAPLNLDDLTGADNAPASSPDFQPIQPPADPMPGMFRHEGKSASACWPYHDATGAVVLVAARFPKPDGDKEVKPFRYGRKGENPPRWHAGLYGLKPMPLYRLPALCANPDGRVLVVEGEKKADAAAGRFPDMIATASQGGSNAARKADWSPVAGRAVVIWPDHDKAGTDYARDVAEMARKAGAASVAVVTIPEHWPVKWDLADALPEGVTNETLRAMLASAVPVETEAAPDAPPDAVALPWGFEMRKRGTRPGLYLIPEASQNNPDAKPVFVAAPFDVIGETSDGTGAGHGAVLQWTDCHGHTHTKAVARRLGHTDGRTLASDFEDAGLHVGTTHSAYENFRRFIVEVRHARQLVSVTRTGWHDPGGNPCFILPGGEAFGPGADHVILQSEAVGNDTAYRTGGTLEGWQQEVAAPAVGNDLLVLGISAGFAATLLDVVTEPSGGFHIFGKSRAGKTTVLRAAASVWGKAASGGMIRQWRATGNGLEGTAAATTDTLLCLDEIGQASGKDVSEVIYTLGNGSGKTRAGRNGEARMPRTWRTLFLSNGEIDLAQKLGEAGLKPMAGQEVRFPSLSADAGAGLGAFQNLHHAADAGSFAKAIEAASQRHYGHAARAFLVKLASDRGVDPDGLREYLDELRNAFLAAHKPAGADGQVASVAQRFALLAAAGELATAWVVVPWPAGEATRAAAACFKRWLAARGGTEAGEDIEAVRMVRGFINAHGTSRFELIRPEGSEHPEEKTINRAGWRRKVEGGEWEYLVTSDAWRSEICKGADPKRVAKVLARKGLLVTDDKGRLQHQTRIRGEGSAPIRVYAVKGAILDAEAGENGE